MRRPCTTHVSGSGAFLPIAVVTWFETSAALTWRGVQDPVLRLHKLGSMACQRGFTLADDTACARQLFPL